MGCITTNATIVNKEILVFATGNLHKLKEVNMMLTQTSFKAVAMHEYNIVDEIIEDGNSMHANAKIKSDFLFNKLDVSAMGEDSGLEIHALDMNPGIYTARFAGPQRNDLDNMNKVLDLLKTTNNRKAQFRSVISLNLKGKTHYFEGVVEGEIALSMSGDSGFGYDPIFIPKGYNKTFAELGSDVKNQFSHRAIAVSKMVDFLRTTD